RNVDLNNIAENQESNLRVPNGDDPSQIETNHQPCLDHSASNYNQIGNCLYPGCTISGANEYSRQFNQYLAGSCTYTCTANNKTFSISPNTNLSTLCQENNGSGNLIIPVDVTQVNNNSTKLDWIITLDDSASNFNVNPQLANAIGQPGLAPILKGIDINVIILNARHPQIKEESVPNSSYSNHYRSYIGRLNNDVGDAQSLSPTQNETTIANFLQNLKSTIQKYGAPSAYPLTPWWDAQEWFGCPTLTALRLDKSSPNYMLREDAKKLVTIQMGERTENSNYKETTGNFCRKESYRTYSDIPRRYGLSYYSIRYQFKYTEPTGEVKQFSVNESLAPINQSRFDANGGVGNLNTHISCDNNPSIKELIRNKHGKVSDISKISNCIRYNTSHRRSYYIGQNNFSDITGLCNPNPNNPAHSSFINEYGSIDNYVVEKGSTITDYNKVIGSCIEFSPIPNGQSYNNRISYLNDDGKENTFESIVDTLKAEHPSSSILIVDYNPADHTCTPNELQYLQEVFDVPLMIQRASQKGINLNRVKICDTNGYEQAFEETITNQVNNIIGMSYSLNLQIGQSITSVSLEFASNNNFQLFSPNDYNITIQNGVTKLNILNKATLKDINGNIAENIIVNYQ
ncbi:hypothetical protein N9N67_08780, partial [Bacteriovoracaceae bacterium]|nr:hypothetical protein [Bacteriovoracaceae bacterium]